MRLLSVLFGILSLYFVFRISQIFLSGKLQIVLVLLLYAFSPLNIFYSQEVRMLSLNLFLCLGSVYYFLVFINSDSKKYGTLYVIYTILALYTHYFSFFILFTQLFLVTVYFYNKKIGSATIKLFYIYFFIINLLYVPWYGVLFDQTSKGQPWRTMQTLLQVGKNGVDYFRDAFLSTYIDFESKGIYYFSMFFGLCIIGFIFYFLLRTINSKSLFTVKSNSILFFFLLPFLIALIISHYQSIVLSRYLSILLPYLFILLVCFSFKFLKRTAAVMAIVLLISVSCYGTYINYSNKFKNNDYRKIISYVENNFNQNDKIIVEPHFMGWAFNYYIGHNESKLNLPEILGWNLIMQIDSLKKRNDLDKVWMILDYSALDKDSYDSLSVMMNNSGYDRVNSKSFYIIPAKVIVEYYKKHDPEF